MKWEILPVNGNLKITLSESERLVWSQLALDDPGKFRSDNTMHELLEPLVANSELTWIRPEQCGALTDAPILGVWDLEENRRRLQRGEVADRGNVLLGGDSGGAWVVDVVQCWGWMSYEMYALQEILLHDGFAILTRGHAIPADDGGRSNALLSRKTPDHAADSGSSPG